MSNNLGETVVPKKIKDEFCIIDIQSSTARLLAGLKIKIFSFVGIIFAPTLTFTFVN
jgi:hypothetical protein